MPVERQLLFLLGLGIVARGEASEGSTRRLLGGDSHEEVSCDLEENECVMTKGRPAGPESLRAYWGRSMDHAWVQKLLGSCASAWPAQLPSNIIIQQ